MGNGKEGKDRTLLDDITTKLVSAALGSREYGSGSWEWENRKWVVGNGKWK